MKYRVRKRCGSSKVIIMVPYPAQGHVTPMFKLASAFQSRGFHPVMVTPDFVHRSISPKIDPQNDGVSCLPIPDDDDDVVLPRDFGALDAAMENNMPFHLDRIIRQFLEEEDDEEIECVVVDLLASWAIEVAERFNVKVAGFWPAMFASFQLIRSIPDLIQAGIISETGNPCCPSSLSILPGQLPLLSTEDLPWLIGTLAATKLRFTFWRRAMERSKTLQWILVNSFPDESMLLCHDKKQDNNSRSYKKDPLILSVAPLSKHAITKSPSFWEEDRSCLDWLDRQSHSSVVYVSFGSWVSPIGDEKLRSLGLALEGSRRPFIWVLRPAWREGLPKGYSERVAKQGKLVSWAPQMEILRHKAVGCYLTHCGWNSTMEAIQCKKSLLCYPVAGDQFVNCAYIVKVWKIGLRITRLGQRDLEEGMKRVMEDNKMKQRLSRIHERIMGKEASSRAMASFNVLIDDLNNFNVESPINKDINQDHVNPQSTL